MNLDWLRRLRHSRGFGVHSPSAYRLIREVFFPSKAYGYYAYPVIEDRACEDYHADLLKLIYRILVEVEPKTVYLPQCRTRGVLGGLIEMACPQARLVDDVCKADFAIYGKDCGERGVAARSRYSFFVDLVIFREEATSAAGHVFRFRNSVFINNDPKLSYQEFLV